jgi:hypothetical protein
VVCCRQRLSSVGLGDGTVHKVGFWVGLRGRHQLVLTGTLGEGPARFLRGSCFRVVSFGDNVLGSPCASIGGVIGRVSVADASLSLSLSLSLAEPASSR